jgi:hypothetical protein
MMHQNPLDAPARYPLRKCLEALKEGRPAADQIFLQKIIDNLISDRIDRSALARSQYN